MTSSNANDTATPAKVDPTRGHSAGPFFVVKDTVITTDRDAYGDPDCPVDKREWIGEFYGSDRAAADAAFAVRAMGSHDALVAEMERLIAATDKVRFKLSQMGHYALAFDLAAAMDTASATLRQAGGDA